MLRISSTLLKTNNDPILSTLTTPQDLSGIKSKIGFFHSSKAKLTDKVFMPVCGVEGLEVSIQAKESLGIVICKVLKIALAIIFFPVGIIWLAKHLLSKEKVTEAPVVVVEEKRGLSWLAHKTKSFASSRPPQIVVAIALAIIFFPVDHLRYFSQESELPPLSSKGWNYTAEGLAIAAAIIVLTAGAWYCSSKKGGAQPRATKDLIAINEKLQIDIAERDATITNLTNTITENRTSALNFEKNSNTAIDGYKQTIARLQKDLTEFDEIRVDAERLKGSNKELLNKFNSLQKEQEVGWKALETELESVKNDHAELQGKLETANRTLGELNSVNDGHIASAKTTLTHLGVPKNEINPETAFKVIEEKTTKFNDLLNEKDNQIKMLEEQITSLRAAQKTTDEITTDEAAAEKTPDEAAAEKTPDEITTV